MADEAKMLEMRDRAVNGIAHDQDNPCRRGRFLNVGWYRRHAGDIEIGRARVDRLTVVSAIRKLVQVPFQIPVGIQREVVDFLLGPWQYPGMGADVIIKNRCPSLPRSDDEDLRNASSHSSGSLQIASARR